jgi:hypothetical protein
MFQTQDGQRKFGSAFRAKKYDEFHAEPAGHTEQTYNEHNQADQSGKGKKQVSKSEQPGTEHETPQEVVKTHGRAHSVHIHHDHENGKHKVVSHHEDGHMHESEHESVADAHDHGKQLANADEDEMQNEEGNADNTMNTGSEDSTESLFNA